MLIPDFLESAAARFPDKSALWHKQEWMSYARLESHSNRFAHALREAGVKTGDRVALLYENSFRYVIAHFAIFKAGAVNVSLNTETSANSLAFLIQDCEANVIIAAGKYLPSLLQIESQIPGLECIFTDHETPA